MARNPRSGIVGRLVEAAEERLGLTVAPTEHVELLEAQATDYSRLRKDMDLLGWQVLDYFGGNQQEVAPTERRKMAQQSRVVWMQDPQAGASVDLLNDFVFGRGVPKPKANDEAVQEVIDEAWDDPDNQLVLTTYDAQVALGVDLSLQSNVFALLFDDGQDGKVKLGLLDHDCVENVVRDPDNRLRILYYQARERRQEWDFINDQPKAMPEMELVQGKPKTYYYEHWRNVESAIEEGAKVPKPPKAKQGRGKVYHIAVNRTTEMAFGVPTMRRTLRWFSAYNDFMKARVDMAQAAAAFVMKRKIKGSPNQVVKAATKALSRTGELAIGPGGQEVQVPPMPGGILNENENISHESMNLNSNAGNAAQDAQMLRSVISASTRFPQHYLGDAGSANLATATAMELPVLKAVEARQEVFEGIFRWFLDRVIEKAVEDGRLDKYADTPEDEATDVGGEETTTLVAGHEDKVEDEHKTERDLGYEFNMPNPLRRMMTDLIGSIANIARTFDPNNTNPELSRVLLTVALGEGLEVEDPGSVVDRVFPEGYVDPLMAAQQQEQNPFAPGGGGEPADQFGGDPFGASGGGDPNNPYGAPMKSTPPEQVQQARLDQAPEQLQSRTRARKAVSRVLFDEEVGQIATQELEQLMHATEYESTNGNGRKKRGDER